jgi:hypothetical protein
MTVTGQFPCNVEHTMALGNVTIDEQGRRGLPSRRPCFRHGRGSASGSEVSIWEASPFTGFGSPDWRACPFVSTHPGLRDGLVTVNADFTCYAVPKSASWRSGASLDDSDARSTTLAKGSKSFVLSKSWPDVASWVGIVLPVSIGARSV